MRWRKDTGKSELKTREDVEEIKAVLRSQRRFADEENFDEVRMRIITRGGRKEFPPLPLVSPPNSADCRNLHVFLLFHLYVIRFF